LRQQLEAELRPVLRDPDFAEFDLDRAFASVAKVAAALGHAVKLPRGAGKKYSTSCVNRQPVHCPERRAA
jgi:hypothetical protein